MPFRPLFEQLGIEIRWNAETRTITGEKEGTRLVLQLDNPVAEVNGKMLELPVAPTLLNNNTFVPLRFVSESIDAKVEWMDASRSAIIQTKREFKTKDGEFHFTAYGKWDPVSYPEAPPELLLAIKYFNHTYLLIHEDSKSGKWKGTTLAEYVKQNRDDRVITREAIIEEKKMKVFDRNALQLTYVDDSDWTKRIVTSIFFETESHFYEIMNNSYEDTYKESINDFQDILTTMTFKQP